MTMMIMIMMSTVIFPSGPGGRSLNRQSNDVECVHMLDSLNVAAFKLVSSGFEMFCTWPIPNIWDQIMRLVYWSSPCRHHVFQRGNSHKLKQCPVRSTLRGCGLYADRHHISEVGALSSSNVRLWDKRIFGYTNHSAFTCTSHHPLKHSAEHLGGTCRLDMLSTWDIHQQHVCSGQPGRPKQSHHKRGQLQQLQVDWHFLISTSRESKRFRKLQ